MSQIYQEIPLNDVSFDPTSYVDPNGRVFHWKGMILRGIDKESASFFKELIESDFFRKLCSERKIVATTTAPYALHPFKLLLQHEKIHPPTYCTEWPSLMLKDAAILTLDIAIELARHNLTLQDAYPWNIYFNGATPEFIDIGSIVPQDKIFIWKAYDQFLHFFLYPLYLHSCGKNKVARLMLSDYLSGISDEDFLKLMPLSHKILNPALLFRATLPFTLNKLIRAISPSWDKKAQKSAAGAKSSFDASSLSQNFLSALRREVEGIKVHEKKRSNWSRYYEERFKAENEETEPGLKIKVISGILDKCRPSTLLDAGCNTGRFSILAAEKGSEVISFDKDECSLNQLYSEAKSKDLKITPLAIDIINPTPAFGWCSKQFPPAAIRLRCDMVLCLALIHHLIFRQWQNFERIAETLDCLSKRWAAVEFIPVNDDFIKLYWEKRFSFYTLDNLTTALERKFPSITVLESFPSGRKILLCEK